MARVRFLLTTMPRVLGSGVAGTDQPQVAAVLHQWHILFHAALASATLLSWLLLEGAGVLPGSVWVCDETPERVASEEKNKEGKGRRQGEPSTLRGSLPAQQAAGSLLMWGVHAALRSQQRPPPAQALKASPAGRGCVLSGRQVSSRGRSCQLS